MSPLPVTAALVGLGNIAWKFDRSAPAPGQARSQAGAMSSRQGVRLAGGCSPDEADRLDFTRATGLPAFATPGEMLDALKPGLVGVCSPTELHHEHARLCLDRGVSMLWLEKPPASSAAQAEELHRLARQRGAVVCVNYMRRYARAYRRLRELVASGAAGTCRLVRILYSKGLAANGSHMLDQAFFLTGAADFELLWAERGGLAANPSFAFRLDTGVLAVASGADLPHHTNDISLCCDTGTYSLRHGGKLPMVERRVENSLYPGFFDLHAQDGDALGPGGFDGVLEAALDDLLDARARGRQPLSSLATALPVQRLMEAVERESRR